MTINLMHAEMSMCVHIRGRMRISPHIHLPNHKHRITRAHLFSRSLSSLRSIITSAIVIVFRRAWSSFADLARSASSSASFRRLSSANASTASLSSRSQWDPKSESYLLIGCKSGAMFLYDVEAAQAVWTFEKISGGLQARLHWRPCAPLPPEPRPSGR